MIFIDTNGYILKLFHNNCLLTISNLKTHCFKTDTFLLSIIKLQSLCCRGTIPLLYPVTKKYILHCIH